MASTLRQSVNPLFKNPDKRGSGSLQNPTDAVAGLLSVTAAFAALPAATQAMASPADRVMVHILAGSLPALPIGTEPGTTHGVAHLKVLE